MAPEKQTLNAAQLLDAEQDVLRRLLAETAQVRQAAFATGDLERLHGGDPEAAVQRLRLLRTETRNAKQRQQARRHLRPQLVEIRQLACGRERRHLLGDARTDARNLVERAFGEHRIEVFAQA
jgi:hypothetical protein